MESRALVLIGLSRLFIIYRIKQSDKNSYFAPVLNKCGQLCGDLRMHEIVRE